MTVIWLAEAPLACRASATALPRRSPRPRLYSRVPRSSVLPSRRTWAIGRSCRYLAWHAMICWNSGLISDLSKSKYTTRWRRQASVSRSSGVYLLLGGGASVWATSGAGAGGAGLTSCFFEQAAAPTHIRAIKATRTVLFMVTSLRVKFQTNDFRHG